MHQPIHPVSLVPMNWGKILREKQRANRLRATCAESTREFRERLQLRRLRLPTPSPARYPAPPAPRPIPPAPGGAPKRYGINPGHHAEFHTANPRPYVEPAKRQPRTRLDSFAAITDALFDGLISREKALVLVRELSAEQVALVD